MASVIQQLQAKVVLKSQVKAEFENLKFPEFELTSSANQKYNCISHAANDPKQKWWWPPHSSSNNDRWWPKTGNDDQSVQNFILAFQIDGYKVCKHGNLEKGFEKVVIFQCEKASPGLKKGDVSHMARQLSNGEWTSKLGRWVDISHKNAKSIGGKKYGKIAKFMKRPIKP